MKAESQSQFRPVWLCGNCLTEQENCGGPVAACLTDEIPLGVCALCNAPAHNHVRILKTDEERARDRQFVELEEGIDRIRLAVSRLGELNADRATYFQADTTKDPEAFKRWKAMNDALADLRDIRSAQAQKGGTV